MYEKASFTVTQRVLNQTGISLTIQARMHTYIVVFRSKAVQFLCVSRK